jgi:uncharacterized protein
MLDEIHPELEKAKTSFAYLFGSQAKNRAHQNSDIDLAIYLQEKNKLQRFETKLYLTSKLSSILKKNVDIVILNDIQNNFLLFDILTEGKLIYNQDNNLRFHYEVTRRHQAIDYLTHLKYANRQTANSAKN